MNGFQLVRGPWQPPPRQDGLGPRQAKTTEENSLQGKYMRPTADPAPYTESYRARLQLKALARLEVAEAVAEIAGRVPAEIRTYPSLTDAWMRSELTALGTAQPELGEAVAEELRTRRSPAWLPAEDIAACTRYLGEYRAPPPPEPERPAHAESYLQAAAMVIAGGYALGCQFALWDPNHPDAAMSRCLDARAAGPASADHVLARVKQGYHLAWMPHGRRLIAPAIEVPGHAWRELPSGEGVVLAPTEPESKPTQKKGGAR